jgi:hypothetical protein
VAMATCVAERPRIVALIRSCATRSTIRIVCGRVTILLVRAVNETLIAEAGRRLVAAAPDAQIVLFDSGAAGAASSPSSVSFLVVEPEVADEAEESVRLHRTLRELRVPADVIVVSRAYANRWRDVRGGVVHVALSQGRVLAG